jgi:hypothetical protein
MTARKKFNFVLVNLDAGVKSSFRYDRLKKVTATIGFE